MARLNWIWLSCGLLLAYGCGRVSSNGKDDAPHESGGSGIETGAAAGRPGGGSSAGGAPAAGPAQGGSAMGANGGANIANGGMLPNNGGAPLRGGSTALGGASASGSSQGGASQGGADFGAAAGNASAGAAGATEAGSGGRGTDPETCAVTVRSDNSVGVLQAAIDAAEVPSTICLEAGGYRGNLTLRDGVSLRGVGWPSIVCGKVVGDAATSRMTTLSDLQIEGGFEATGSVQLALRNLEINTWHTAICAPGSDPVRITQDGGGTLNLLIDGVTLSSPGFEINLAPGHARFDDTIVLQNSRCDSTSQCYDFLRFTFDTAPAAEAAAGSRLALDVANNVVRNIVLEGVVFDIHGKLSIEDSASSRLWFRHNTLASAGDLNSAVAFWTAPTLPVVLANNVIAYIETPVVNLDSPYVVNVGNVFSDDASSRAWFTDFALGDFSPSPASPLIGAGVETYAVPTDITGKARTGSVDSGAYQH